MKQYNKQPLILLVSQCAEENKMIKKWVTKHHLLMCETEDVFEALETITDFTMEQCPDVIMLHVDSPSKDLDEITEMIDVYSDSKDVMVAVLTSQYQISTRRKCSVQQISTQPTNLDSLLPALSRAATRNM